MALTTAGKTMIAEKLAQSVTNTGTNSGTVAIFIMDSDYAFVNPNDLITNATTGYVTDTTATMTSSANKVVMQTMPREITIPTTSYVKRYVIASKNVTYGQKPFVVNTTIGDTVDGGNDLGTYYEFGGKFVITLFEFEVN